MELQRAKALQHDLIKSYVRLPDLQQRRMVEFAREWRPGGDPRDLTGGPRRPGFKTDPRFDLYPSWMRAAITGPPNPAFANFEGGGAGQMVINIQKAGGRIVAGTDSPNAANLHGELLAYVLSGMTPYQALKTATVNPAEALGLDAGSIEPGKLADLVIVKAIRSKTSRPPTRRKVIANGRVYEMAELLTGKSQP